MYYGNEMDFSPWISPCKKKIGIDCGAAYGGSLCAMVAYEDASYEFLHI
jgi:hypothetical protein